MNPHHDRALMLFNRDRYEEAASELHQGIAQEADNPLVHGLLALCLSQLDRHQKALEAARKAIEIAPDLDYGHWVLARVYTERGRLAEAFETIQTAIQLGPDDAANHGLLARIEFQRGNWEAAVKAADAGLALDAESDMCLHFRSLALTKLGRQQEAERDQEVLLAADPNDPYTHAARGWTLLEQGETDKAREHFLESLRLDPNNQEARAGLVNALKARHFIFGVALRCLLYLDRFRSWAIWIFFIGLFVGLRQLDRLTSSYAQFTVAMALFKAAFFACFYLILLAHPLFNLVLRLDRDGRRALTPDQIRASNWHAMSLLMALALGLLWAWKGDVQMRLLAMSAAMLTIAITNTFDATPGWVRVRMMWITFFAAVLIPLSFVLFVTALYLLVRHKVNTVWMVKLSLAFLPLTSVLISAFSDNIAAFLEKRRPDASPH
jgi:tetratricopeptide (TPR) repeat protein